MLCCGVQEWGWVAGTGRHDLVSGIVLIEYSFLQVA